MRNIASTFVFVGLVATSLGFRAESFLDIPTKVAEQLGQSSPVQVTYNMKLLNAGKFRIGANNDSISMRPMLNLDYSIIAARNCSQCPTRTYDVDASEH